MTAPSQAHRLSLEKGVEHRERTWRLDRSRTETEHIEPLTTDPLACRLGIIDERGADLAKLTGGDRDTDPRAADQ